ncbi:retrovirus-related pol polyprotein from transposon TNT 1-94 [Tanacetum coccineum]
MVEMLTRMQGGTEGFNTGNASDESNQIIQRVPRTESTPGKANVQCYNCNEKGHYACEFQKPKVRDAKYFREQILLAMKDEVGSNLNNEKNDFMLDTSYGEDLEELTVAVILMARLQPANENAETVPSYDAKAVSQVHASSKVHEQVSHRKRKTIIQTTDDDQIDSNIIFDDPFVENNGGMSEHDSTAHDEYREIQMLAYNVQQKKAFKEREDRYLDDILDIEEKLSSHDRIVYKMGQSIQMIHMLGKKPNKIYDPFLKGGLGYTNPVRLKKVVASQPKMYDGDLIHNNKLFNVLYETFVPQQELSAEQTYFSIPSTYDNGSTSKDVPSELPEQQKHELLKAELEKRASDSRDIQANLLKRIKILENDFQRSQTQSIDFELKLQHQKEKMDCDVSWKAKLSTLHDENVLLKHQVDSTVKERENIKLEFQKLFNSIKATRALHQNEINEMFEDVTQKTYAYADVRAQNQDLLMTIYELKSKLKTIDKGKHVNTKFDKSKTLGQLLCVTPFNKNLAIKAKNMSNSKVTSDRLKPITSQSTPIIEQ